MVTEVIFSPTVASQKFVFNSILQYEYESLGTDVSPFVYLSNLILESFHLVVVATSIS